MPETMNVIPTSVFENVPMSLKLLNSRTTTEIIKTKNSKWRPVKILVTMARLIFFQMQTTEVSKEKIMIN